MNLLPLRGLYLLLCLISVLGIPIPTEPHENHKPGDYVGVRAKAYEEKNPHVVSIAFFFHSQVLWPDKSDRN